MNLFSHTRSFEWGTIALLAALFFYLLHLIPEIPPLPAGGSFALLLVYHLVGKRPGGRDPFRSPGIAALHLGIYLFLAALVVWTTTTPPEESIFWVVFLLPIMVAAFHTGLLATIAVAATATVIYFLSLPGPIEVLDSVSDEFPEFVISAMVFFVVGLLVQFFSQEMRQQLEIQKDLNQSLQESLEQLAAAEERLRRQDRLAALGEMAAGVAHEIRNPLGIISSSAQLLSRKEGRGDGTTELLHIIRAETDRLNSLVTDFMAFGRETVPQIRSCDVEELVSRVFERCQAMATEKNLTFVKPTAPVPLQAELDPDLMAQVLLNLCLNSLDATPSGGRVEASWGAQDHALFIEIHDTGDGIPADIQDKIFNPFFTTKDTGTGLGLANAFKFVQAHGGTLSFESSPGKGTTFRINLPQEASVNAPRPGRR
jgi:signal transduction histidine kinase